MTIILIIPITIERTTVQAIIHSKSSKSQKSQFRHLFILDRLCRVDQRGFQRMIIAVRMEAAKAQISTGVL